MIQVVTVGFLLNKQNGFDYNFVLIMENKI